MLFTVQVNSLSPIIATFSGTAKSANTSVIALAVQPLADVISNIQMPGSDIIGFCPITTVFISEVQTKVAFGSSESPSSITIGVLQFNCIFTCANAIGIVLPSVISTVSVFVQPLIVLVTVNIYVPGSVATKFGSVLISVLFKVQENETGSVPLNAVPEPPNAYESSPGIHVNSKSGATDTLGS